jgi:hypothetical protein
MFKNIFKFGDDMAKKRVKVEAKPVKKRIKSVEPSDAKKDVEIAETWAVQHIKSLSKRRRDCTIIWGKIKNKPHSDEEIMELLRAGGPMFDSLVSEISK